jgi:MYXO-CTERM domain-containing protein
MPRRPHAPSGLVRRLTVATVLIASFAGVAKANPFFTDSFETETPDGGFPTWTDVLVNPENALGVTNTQAFDGVQSLQVQFLVSPPDGGPGAPNAYLEKNVVYVGVDSGTFTGSSTLFIRFYFFIPAGFTLPTGASLVVASATEDNIDAGVVDGRIQVTLTGSATQPLLSVGVETSTGTTTMTPATGTALATGAWHYVEAGVNSAAAGGQAWLYVDGQTFASTPEDTGGFVYASARVGLSGGTSTTATQWFVDDVELGVTLNGPDCSDASLPGCAPDAGVPDAGPPDSGVVLPDAGSPPDAGPDAGAADAGGVVDSGPADSGSTVVDSGSVVDSGVPDSGSAAVDSGVADSGVVTCGPSNCGTCCTVTNVCSATGDTNNHCGTGGNPCQACTGGQICMSGVCTTVDSGTVVDSGSVVMDSGTAVADGGPLGVSVNGPLTVVLGNAVQMTATGSGGVGMLTYFWTPVAYPEGYAPTLTNPSLPVENFTPPAAGDYSFRVVVTDSTNASAEAFVLVTATTGGCGCGAGGSPMWALLFLGLATIPRKARRLKLGART